MKVFLTILAVVFSIHFLVKGCSYAGARKTKGVIVDQNSFSYGSITGWASTNVPYPVVVFRDVDNHSTRAEVLLEEVIDAVGWDSGNKYNMKYLIADKEKQLSKEREAEIGMYTTTTPYGSYFFTAYPVGATMSVIYDPGHPEQAIVCSFFSYWLTIPAFMVLFMVCLIFFAIYKFSTYPKNE